MASLGAALTLHKALKGAQLSLYSPSQCTTYNAQFTMHCSNYTMYIVHKSSIPHIGHVTQLLHTEIVNNLIGTYFPLEVLIHNIDTTFSPFVYICTYNSHEPNLHIFAKQDKICEVRSWPFCKRGQVVLIWVNQTKQPEQPTN